MSWTFSTLAIAKITISLVISAGRKMQTIEFNDLKHSNGKTRNLWRGKISSYGTTWSPRTTKLRCWFWLLSIRTSIKPISSLVDDWLLPTSCPSRYWTSSERIQTVPEELSLRTQLSSIMLKSLFLLLPAVISHAPKCSLPKCSLPDHQQALWWRGDHSQCTLFKFLSG